MNDLRKPPRARYGGAARAMSPREPGSPHASGRSGAASLVLGVVLLLIGAGVLCFPVASDLAARSRAAEAIGEMRAGALEDSAQVQDADGETFRSKEGDAAYERLVAYNAAVRAGTGDAVNDPFAFPAGELESFDLPDGIIGSITAPAMGIEIPLYLGATSDHLAHGAGVIAGTSLPLGEETSNTVIAAHRGSWYGLNMFRDIEDLSAGDQVIIETPWDRLVYRVTSFEVISPDEVDALAIEEGRSMVTLFTCHPYGHNYQRILVHCDLDVGARAEEAPSPLESALMSFFPTGWSDESPLLNLEGVLRLAGVALLLACSALLIARAARRLARRGAGGGADDPRAARERGAPAARSGASSTARADGRMDARAAGGRASNRGRVDGRAPHRSGKRQGSHFKH